MVRNSQCATFWYSGREKTKKPTSRWNSGSVTPKSLRWSHSTISCQCSSHDARPTDEPRAGGERQVHGRRDPPQPAAGRVARQPGVARRGALDDPEVGQQEHRRAKPGEAAGQPLAREHRPEDLAPGRARGTTASRSGTAPRSGRAASRPPGRPSTSAERTRGRHHQRPAPARGASAATGARVRRAMVGAAHAASRSSRLRARVAQQARGPSR